MSVRFLTTITVGLFLVACTYAEIYEPRSYKEAMHLLDDFKDNVTVIAFVDYKTINSKLVPSEEEKEETEEKGFFGNLFGSISGIFSSSDRTMSDIVSHLGNENILIEVNATDTQYDRLQDMFNVPSIPYIVVKKGTRTIYRNVPTNKADEKIKAVVEAYTKELKEREKAKEDEVKAAKEAETQSEVIKIEPGKVEFKANSQDDPFLFKTNETVEYTPQEVVKTTTITAIPKYPTYDPPTAKNSTETSKSSRLVETLVPKAGSKLVNVGAKNTTSTTYTTIPMGKVQRRIPAPDSTNRVVYTDVITERYMPEIIEEERYVVSGYKPRTGNATSTKYVSTPYGYRASDSQFDKIDQRWKKILQDEEKMVDEIKKIYNDDAKLSDTLKESEEEIHESEELFYKAKNAIDKTLHESENQMLQYENELDRLYRARQSAIKAREDLYHPCPNCVPTKDGYIRQKMTTPYKVIRRPGGPAPANYNFHDMYESASGKNTTDSR